MTVESNNTIAIATFSDWLKNLAPGKPEPGNQGRFFPRFEQVARNDYEFDWFIALFVPAVIGRSNLKS